ncbi:uncharacterized protein LOC134259308 [Saccostrea cucullata]|uniref:uncharacterized protein LOC134259308 n=1 Tax=Saccostrea cuccullata TaxID=36930 RepID=UPI002ED43D63
MRVRTSIYIILGLIFNIVILSADQILYQRVNLYPHTSCSRSGGLYSALWCYRRCVRVFGVPFLVSYDEEDQTCYCCNKAPGQSDSEITGTGLHTFRTGHCPLEYTAVDYKTGRICLRYVESAVKYLKAKDICTKQWGDLIRLDSLDKHNILRSFVESKRQSAEVDVWVQGVDHNGTWRYHDNQEFTYTCLGGDSQNPAEIYLRARSKANYGCNDSGPWRVATYLCEIFIPKHLLQNCSSI